MADDGLAVANFMCMGLSAVFQGILALQAVVSRAGLGLKQPVVCPNCGQSFDAADFPLENRVRKVTCPRCRYTWVP